MRRWAVGCRVKLAGAPWLSDIPLQFAFHLVQRRKSDLTLGIWNRNPSEEIQNSRRRRSFRLLGVKSLRRYAWPVEIGREKSSYKTRLIESHYPLT
ncbi:hypothetical protein J6590_040904 [Homalodisca vitripennis]|nr:hypothetical protein J6590_040904 [Homalodisca vitripennis]